MRRIKSYSVFLETVRQGFDETSSTVEIKNQHYSSITIKDAEVESNTTYLSCSFDNVVFDNAVFDTVKFKNTNFERCRFNNCEFTEYSELTGCKFDNCEFKDCKAGANVQVSQCNFRETHVDGFVISTMKSCEFKHGMITDLTIDYLLDECIFDSVIINDFICTNSRIERGIFESCEIKNLRLDKSLVFWCKFIESDIDTLIASGRNNQGVSKCEFIGGNINKMSLSGIMVSECLFKGVKSFPDAHTLSDCSITKNTFDGSEVFDMVEKGGNEYFDNKIK